MRNKAAMTAVATWGPCGLQKAQGQGVVGEGKHKTSRAVSSRALVMWMQLTNLAVGKEKYWQNSSESKSKSTSNK